jgi:hypothetical protein
MCGRMGNVGDRDGAFLHLISCFPHVLLT